ncbi:MAG TPA: 30S ribosomal protein S20 [Candidatus Hydrogenedentes bacterium]|nr:30S ribosomal protein S20 [Candidatus Hydrogenedentota bacterium]HOL77898.1 30S ribosomal protein S20 [Candidatus Hydrogenedentota bacterium]HPO87132.1 30S ribosomal protein S20 [Candidatus Hydrogenedentota bacterium]
MANIKSAKKRIKQNERNRLRNISVRSRMKTFMKKALEAIAAKDTEKLGTTLPQALSEIDRAASKGVIHKNSAARKKSMLQRRAALLK